MRRSRVKTCDSYDAQRCVRPASLTSSSGCVVQQQVPTPEMYLRALRTRNPNCRIPATLGGALTDFAIWRSGTLDALVSPRCVACRWGHCLAASGFSFGDEQRGSLWQVEQEQGLPTWAGGGIRSRVSSGSFEQPTNQHCGLGSANLAYGGVGVSVPGATAMRRLAWVGFTSGVGRKLFGEVSAGGREVGVGAYLNISWNRRGVPSVAQ